MSSFPENESYPMECTSCGTTIETVHDSHNGFPLVEGRVCGTVQCRASNPCAAFANGVRLVDGRQPA